MTYEEAKTVLINCTTFIKDGFRFMKEEHINEFKEAYNMALQALEKQIPKKPIISQMFDDTFTCNCPICGGDLLHDYGEYCPDCGQSIDWSDEDTKKDGKSFDRMYFDEFKQKD